MKKAFLAITIYCASAAMLVASGINDGYLFSGYSTYQDDKKMGKQDDKSKQDDDKKVVLDVPDNIKNAFKSSHPDVMARWSMEDGKYVANYKDKVSDMKMAVAYNKDATVAYTEKELKREGGGYPDAIGSYYRDKYPNEKEYTVWMVERDGEQTYITKHKGRKLMFDKSGKFTKESPKEKSKMDKKDKEDRGDKDGY